MLINFKPPKNFFNDGTIILAGAGPGDPKLLTLKVYQAIKMADVIIYDALVGKDIICLAKNKCKLIFAGKLSNNKSCSQEDIISWMKSYSKLNKKVLRLKGGDPSIFGRGAEELQALKKVKISIKVFSGITAGQEALKKLKISYFNNETKSFSLITGHRAIINKKEINFKKLSAYEGRIIIYMGLSHLNNIANKLINFGKCENTSVKIITNISLKNERIFTTKLKNCVLEKNKFGLKPPAIIIIN
tara:strand:+ start:12967 stop:13701 length:735 start_codon:yes stop_codon:yes gene_type:complete